MGFSPNNLSTMRIAICGLARDCASRLSRNLRTLHKLTRYGVELRYFIVENDSKDATAHILHAWQEQYKSLVYLPNFYEYYEKIHADTQIEIDSDRSKDSVSDSKEIFKSRISRISLARDAYLHALCTSEFTPDIVIMVDFDVYAITLSGIIKGLQNAQKWDVLTANCRKYEYRSRWPFIHNIYYDSYAVEYADTPAIPFDWNTDVQNTLSPLASGDDWYAVHSAFGGVAMYDYNALLLDNNKDGSGIASYLYSIARDKYQYCEHVSFHRTIRENGHENIFISPSLLVYYNTIIHAIGYGISRMGTTT